MSASESLAISPSSIAFSTATSKSYLFVGSVGIGFDDFGVRSRPLSYMVN